MKCLHCSSQVAPYTNKKLRRKFCDSTCYGAWQRGRSFLAQGKKTEPRRDCSIEGCGNPHSAHGYCHRHYCQLVVYPRKPKPPRTRFDRPVISKTCGHCGALFETKRATAKYCRQSCYAAASTAPFITKKGYRKVLLHKHPRADGKGYVFEHIVVAEKKIGRSLGPKEEVHHIDHVRTNNNPENLLVCATHAAHMRLHHTTSGPANQ